MHDVIHASIARQRVQELVDDAAVERVARSAQRRPATERVTSTTSEAPRSHRRMALLRLRPRLR